MIIVTDPRSDAQAIREASYCNVPVIAIADTDSSIPFVDVVIPANNKGKHSLGLVLWMLCREVLRLRGTYARSGENAWNVMPDMFFYRDPEEQEQSQDKAAGLEAGNEQQQAAPEWEVSGAAVGPTLAAGQSAIPGQVDSGLDWAAVRLLTFFESSDACRTLPPTPTGLRPTLRASGTLPVLPATPRPSTRRRLPRLPTLACRPADGTRCESDHDARCTLLRSASSSKANRDSLS